MLDRLSPRIAALLLSMLAFVPGCEPDECDLEFSYRVNWGDLYKHVWHAPATECSAISGTLGEGDVIRYERDAQNLNISLPLGSWRLGVQEVNVSFSDEFGNLWTSRPGELDGSDCVAVVHSVEIVDWVKFDHLRLSGTLSCTGPLQSNNPSLDEEPDQLQLLATNFSLYVAQGL